MFEVEGPGAPESAATPGQPGVGTPKLSHTELIRGVRTTPPAKAAAAPAAGDAADVEPPAAPQAPADDAATDVEVEETSEFDLTTVEGLQAYGAQLEGELDDAVDKLGRATMQASRLSRERQEALGLLADKTAEVERLTAEFSRFRERTRDEVAAIKRDAIKGPALDLIAQIDNLDLALEHLPADHREGVELVRDGLLQALAKHGVTRMECDKAPWNAAEHEAIARIDTPEVKEATVWEVIRPGYMLNDKVLRPAQVVVAKPA